MLPQEDPALLVIDMKGDLALFHATREAARSAKKSFRYFTVEPGCASYFFNPFVDLGHSGGTTTIQFAELLMEALALIHGPGYGRAFFTKQSREALLHELARGARPFTFKELLEALERGARANAKGYREAIELVATIRAMTFYPQLNTTRQAYDPQKSIHMGTLLAERQVAYFWLPSARESVSAQEIAKLALFALLTAAMKRQPRTREQRENDRDYGFRRAYVVIDEFQRLASENFKVVLEQARSFGVSVILSNQSLSELKTPSTDLRPVVTTNTRSKIHFSVQNALDRKELSDSSGQDVSFVPVESTVQVRQRFGLTANSVATTSGMTMTIRPRLSVSDLQSISDHPRRCVLHVSRGAGLTQFGGLAIPVEVNHVHAAPYYEQLSRMPWPEDPDLIHSSDTPASVEEKAKKEVMADPKKVIKDLFDQYSDSPETES